MNVHSRILVHWTGKDIETCRDNEKPRHYIERLTDYYQHGLFLKRSTEDVIRKVKINNLARLCFTEIRLSETHTHASRYGKLGIGFARDFILNKGSRPVIYIPFEPKEDSCLLEDNIKKVYENAGDNDIIQNSIKWIMAHVKRMSNENNEDFFEEMEWRLVFDENPNNKHFTKGEAEGIYRLLFKANDIKIIVFPDEYIRQKSLENEIVKKYFSKFVPILATLDDCHNF